MQTCLICDKRSIGASVRADVVDRAACRFIGSEGGCVLFKFTVVFFWDDLLALLRSFWNLVVVLFDGRSSRAYLRCSGGGAR